MLASAFIVSEVMRGAVNPPLARPAHRVSPGAPAFRVNEFQRDLLHTCEREELTLTRQIQRASL